MFKKNNLRTKLIISYAAIILASFFVISVFFYFYIRSYMRSNMEDNIVELSSGISSQLDSELANLDRIALGMLGNKDFIDALTALNNRPVYDTSFALEVRISPSTER